MLTHAAGLLCVLAATVFATSMTPRWQDTGLLVAGFVLAAFWLRPEPGPVGWLIASVAASRLATRTARSGGRSEIVLTRVE